MIQRDKDEQKSKTPPLVNSQEDKDEEEENRQTWKS